MAVLLVEDDDGVRELLARLLRSYGYSVLMAATAEEAEAIATAAPAIDLLVCDVYLPGASGPELARRLSTRHRGLRILMMSGDPSSDTLVHGAVAGATFVGKPFTPARFMTIVRGLLET